MVSSSFLANQKTRRDLLRGAGRLGAGALGAAALARGGVAPTRAAAQDGQVTLEFWNTFSDAEIKLLHQFGDEYMQLNPNIKINFFEIPFDQRPTKIPTAVETNSLPDIIRADYPYQWYLGESGKLLPLDEYLSGWEMRDAIYDITWQEVTLNGQIIGIPQDKFTSVLCYNVDKFKRDGVETFPATWDELVDAAKRMTHDDEYGIAFKFGSGFDVELWSLILQAGGQVFDDQGQPAMNSEQGVQALQFAVDLVNTHKVMPPGVANFAYAEADDALKSGKLGMAVFGSWQIANYREAGIPWELGIGAWPAGPGGARGTLTSTTTYMVTNTSEHPEEAVELLKWIVSKENALRWAKTLDHEPIDEFTAADPHFQQPIFQAFHESLQFAQIHPPEPRYNAISAAFNDAGQKAVLGEATSQQALDELAATAKEVVSQ